MTSIYSTDDGHAPPLSHLQTWALGFQIQDHRVIEDKVLPLMKRKMDRLDASEYETFYEDEPEGFGNVDLLSRDKCKVWLQSIADLLMDSEEFDEEEIFLYEFSDRPEGFPKPELSEVLEPWKHADVAMFNTLRNNGTPAPNSIAATLPPARPSGAPEPGERGVAAAGDGSGPSIRPSKTDPNHEAYPALKESIKQQKIAGIRAALQYNGYPPDGIEDLLENNLQIWKRSTDNFFYYKLELPTGKIAESYDQIDANPYPGGKVTENSARKCYISEDCTKPFGHPARCSLPELNESKDRLDPNKTSHEIRKPGSMKNPSAAAGAPDSAGPSRGNTNQNIHISGTLDEFAHHVTFGVRTALVYAGYPAAVVESMMKNDFGIVAYPNSKSQKYRWSLKMPNGKLAREKCHILNNPYPGGVISVNPICHTVGCGKEFNHFGRCPVPPSQRYRVKREAELDPVSPPPVTKKSRDIYPSPLSNLPFQSSQGPLSPQQIAEAISKKKKSLLKVLEQARYPTPVAEKLLKEYTFKPYGVDRNGNILIKYQVKLPNGSYASNDESILLNPYSLAGDGYDFQRPHYAQKKQLQKEKTDGKDRGIVAGSSSEEGNEESEEQERPLEQEPRPESPISLLTTEEEDYVDEEREDIDIVL